MALDGCHTRSDRFAEAWCSFDYLDAWADPPPVAVDGDDQDAVQVRLAVVNLTSGGNGVALLDGRPDARPALGRAEAVVLLHPGGMLGQPSVLDAAGEPA